MTQETYENIMRVLQKRINRARVIGDNKMLAEAIAEKQKLMDSTAKEGLE